jgi:hypothetical protein
VIHSTGLITFYCIIPQNRPHPLHWFAMHTSPDLAFAEQVKNKIMAELGVGMSRAI